MSNVIPDFRYTIELDVCSIYLPIIKWLGNFMNILHRLLLLSILCVDLSAEPPRLVLQITVDQLRGDQLTRFSDRLSDGGFRYFLDEGTVYANAHHSHANTETIPGLYTDFKVFL